MGAAPRSSSVRSKDKEKSRDEKIASGQIAEPTLTQDMLENVRLPPAMSSLEASELTRGLSRLSSRNGWVRDLSLGGSVRDLSMGGSQGQLAIEYPGHSPALSRQSSHLSTGRMSSHRGGGSRRRMTSEGNSSMGLERGSSVLGAAARQLHGESPPSPGALSRQSSHVSHVSQQSKMRGTGSRKRMQSNGENKMGLERGESLMSGSARLSGEFSPALSRQSSHLSYASRKSIDRSMSMASKRGGGRTRRRTLEDESPSAVGREVSGEVSVSVRTPRSLSQDLSSIGGTPSVRSNGSFNRRESHGSFNGSFSARCGALPMLSPLRCRWERKHSSTGYRTTPAGRLASGPALTAAHGDDDRSARSQSSSLRECTDASVRSQSSYRNRSGRSGRSRKSMEGRSVDGRSVDGRSYRGAGSSYSSYRGAGSVYSSKSEVSAAASRLSKYFDNGAYTAHYDEHQDTAFDGKRLGKATFIEPIFKTAAEVGREALKML